MYDSNKDKRHSIRLKEYNYAKEGMYFITICIKNRKCLLGEIREDKIQLNDIGKVVEKELLRIKVKFSKFNISIYQLMPNHIHFILEIIDKNNIAIGNIIRHFKGKVYANSKICWQRNYYEHIIRNEKEYYAITNYIINNPYNWKEDENYI